MSISREAFEKYIWMLGKREEYMIFGGRPEWNEKSQKFGIPQNSPFKATEWVKKDELFEKLKEYQEKDWSVWVSLNEKEPGVDKIEGVNAIHVIWFDFDAPRKNKAVPATEPERQQALEAARRFQQWMVLKYGVRGFLACSGNGFHLFFPVERFPLPGKNFRKEFNKKQGQWMKELKKLSKVEFDTTTDIRRVTQPIGFPNVKIPGKPIPTYWVEDFDYEAVVSARQQNKKLIDEILDTELKNEIIVTQGKPHPKLGELLEKNEKMKDLYNGIWQKYGYPSRSEAEQALVTWLCGVGFSDEEINDIMMGCKIGKWQERGEAYRKITLQKGRIFVAKEEEKNGNGGKEKKNKQSKDEEKITMEDILSYLFEEYRFITTEDTEDVYYYNNGVYRPASAKIKSEVEGIWGEQTSTHKVDEVIGHIKRRTYVDREKINKDKNYLPVKNGLLNLNTFELEPFTPEKIFTFKLDIEYDPEADCPMFKKFISEVVRAEDIPIIQEYMGYLLYPDMPSHKSLWLYGVGRNGKSTLARIIKGMLGSRNVISIPLEELDGNHRFAVAQFYGKLVNIVSEPATRKAMETVLFKKLTGGDWIDGEVKNKQRRIGFYNFAKFIILGNRYPQVRDTTPSFWDRLIIIEFPNRFVGSQAKKNLADEILEKEKSGILNWMLEGLKRLKENDFNFTESKSTEKMKIEFKRLSNSVESFIEEMLERDTDFIIPKNELYEHYKDYCESLGLPVVGKSEFTKGIFRLPFVRETTQKVNGKNTRCWRGVRVKALGELKNEDLEEEPQGIENRFLERYTRQRDVYPPETRVLFPAALADKLVEEGTPEYIEPHPNISNTSNPSENDRKMVKVRFLQDLKGGIALPQGDIYPNEGDIREIPQKAAKILLSKGLVEIINNEKGLSNQKLVVKGLSLSSGDSGA